MSLFTRSEPQSGYPSQPALPAIQQLSLTLLQLAIGCALLVFGLRVLGPAPVQTLPPEWPAPVMTIQTPSEAAHCERKPAATEAGNLQSAACVTAVTRSVRVTTIGVPEHF